ncbi:YMGG-like glycine zipper-containing protein [Rhodoblastus sp.]|jgi:outer membrane lipoprotein SlyB|uniref:YMGG-like glycine zipper-containing protein n=1 Tax=Rhodoblastus sp. TaxID=1962975 RepID=UPI0026068765|nr:YMGG-like glycine zipper-containing protein [Rhodoblastus sp.]
MFRRIGAVVFLTLALATPVHEATAQDVLGGALLGAAGGAVVGGVIGRGEGAAIGAVVGAATGAAIAAEGQRRRNNYYAYRHGCYRQRPDGRWVRVPPRYCY